MWNQFAVSSKLLFWLLISKKKAAAVQSLQLCWSVQTLLSLLSHNLPDHAGPIPNRPTQRWSTSTQGPPPPSWWSNKVSWHLYRPLHRSIVVKLANECLSLILCSWAGFPWSCCGWLGRHWLGEQLDVRIILYQPGGVWQAGIRQGGHWLYVFY